MKYDPIFFKNNMPEWKKAKDPITVKFFYRPVSFYLSAVCVQLNISANTITMLSLIITTLANVCYFLSPQNHMLALLGAVFVNLWLLLDCTDGNIARSIKKQPYGDFLDALGSYILAAFIGLSISIEVYFYGGICFAKGNYFVLIFGGLSCIFDILMRLTHQRFQRATIELQEKGIIKKENKGNKTNTLKTRIQMEFGIGGILPPIILIFTLTKTLDLVVLYLFVYNGLCCGAILLQYIFLTTKYFEFSLYNKSEKSK